MGEAENESATKSGRGSKRGAAEAGLDDASNLAKPGKKSKKLFHFEPVPLTDKRKLEWNSWITERFSTHSKSFPSWPGLHELYVRSVKEPISFADFEALRKEHPILKLVARNEFLQGYTLDQNYMEWLKEHREVKWKKLSKPISVPSKQAVGKAASKKKDECSISSVSKESIVDTNGFDGTSIIVVLLLPQPRWPSASCLLLLL